MATFAVTVTETYGFEAEPSTTAADCRCRDCGRELGPAGSWVDGYGPLCGKCAGERVFGPLMGTDALKGWVCTQCGRTNAPSAQMCPCWNERLGSGNLTTGAEGEVDEEAE